MADTGVWTLVLLALFGLAGGVGITAIGPGGVLPTIGMFLLTPLAPAGVAGTAIVTHVATGVAGTYVYTRSGQLREAGTRRTALLLCAAALVGTPLGVRFNTAVDGRVFGVLLACAVAVTGLLVLLRDLRARGAGGGQLSSGPGPWTVGGVGLLVSVAAGLFGLGGPMLSVPLLVLLGLPVLSALAAAQAQSVVIASAGTVGYVLHGAVDWTLAAVVGLPELAGVFLGWRVAHAVPARTLKYALVTSLLVLAPYLALHG